MALQFIYLILMCGIPVIVPNREASGTTNEKPVVFIRRLPGGIFQVL
jgi:hypothetical protein